MACTCRSYCRQYPKGVYTNVSDLIVGTKGRSNGMDMGAKGINPYVQEHINMIRSIRGDGPYFNYSLPIAESTLTAIMARESAYSGQEDHLGPDHELAVGSDAKGVRR